jgi:predicted CopG family antitoxin
MNKKLIKLDERTYTAISILKQEKESFSDAISRLIDWRRV